jgi:hypothetical protein
MTLANMGSELGGNFVSPVHDDVPCQMIERAASPPHFTSSLSLDRDSIGWGLRDHPSSHDEFLASAKMVATPFLHPDPVEDRD